MTRIQNQAKSSALSSAAQQTSKPTEQSSARTVPPSKNQSAQQDAVVSANQGAPVSVIQTPVGQGPLIPPRVKPLNVKVGDYAVLSGRVENRSIMGIGGEAPPSGSYLLLDKPIKVDGKQFKEVFLHGAEHPDGTKLKLNGRVDKQPYGGVETQGAFVMAVSGLSNLGLGEPKFDGKGFKNASGKSLEVLSYNRPLMMDAPARLFVLDVAHNRAFLGSMGGHIPPYMNPFHGFRGQAAIETATEADRKAVKTDAEGNPVNATTGKALVKISEDEVNTQPHPDQMFHSWYLDEDSNTAYRLASGGIAGFQNRPMEVIRAQNE